MPAYATFSLPEQARIREDFRTKFGILRGAFPNFQIPELPAQASLEEIHSMYEVYIKHIHISTSVDQYRVYMVIGWLLLEIFACRLLGLNCSGYTIAQLAGMTRYERLLIELGEKNYNAGPSSWPVEFRLLLVSLFNALIFVVTKTLAGYVGDGAANGIMDAIVSFLSGHAAPHPATQPAMGVPSGAVPPPQPAGQGMDLANLIGRLGSMFANPAAPVTPATAQPHRPRPRYPD